MAAKLLHSLADDNPDLQKQIGCMTGIIQIFDRQHFVSGRRPNQRKALLPPSQGNSKFSNGNLDADSSNVYSRETVERNHNDYLNEKRVSTESSRASFSCSSHSSSFSSLDFGGTGQPEPSSMDRITFPEIPSRDPVISQTSSSPKMGRYSIDLRDVVKDSMHRDSRGPSVQTITKEVGSSYPTHNRDSLRHLQTNKLVDRSLGVGIDIKECLRARANLRDAQWSLGDQELPRLSCESKDRSSLSVQRDGRRLSCDGREVNERIKDGPRLSLDSRESSARSTIVDSKSNLQSSPTQSRASSVVAKLMGLDMLPNPKPVSESSLGPIKTSREAHGSPLLPLRVPDACRPVRLPKSPRSSRKDPSSPKWKTADTVMKPVSSSKFPNEPAPWKHVDSGHASPKQASRQVISSVINSKNSTSVFGEIEKRWKDIEFNQSGKDLRALKQILEAMQGKGLLEGHDDEQSLNLKDRRENDMRVGASRNGGSGPSKAFESPIVIIKPGKLVQKSGIPASSTMPTDGLPGLQRRQSNEGSSYRKSSTANRITRDHVTRDITRDSRRDQAVSTAEKKPNIKNTRLTPSSSKSPQVVKDISTNSLKSSGSISPRLQQKKPEFDKKHRPPTPPSESIKTRSQIFRHSNESISPGGGRRRLPKNSSVHPNDDQPTVTDKDSRKYNSSMLTDSVSNLESRIDIDEDGAEQPVEIASYQRATVEAVKMCQFEQAKEDVNLKLSEMHTIGDFAVGPEQPSPVSVLDSVYMEGSLSPVKHTSHSLEAEVIPESNDKCTESLWSSEDKTSFVCTASNEFPSEINRKKLQSIDNLVQKLRRLNSTHDEAQTDYIASLCENTNPDDRYISEILLASGLLLRELCSGLTAFQLHPSGYPINPELFFVLEQTKASSLLAKGDHNAADLTSPKPEKFHRKLIFDTVNELLAGKLGLVGPPPEPWFKPEKLARKTLNAQKLLRELCGEIELLQARKQELSVEEEEDSLKTVLLEDVMHRSNNWTDFRGDVSGIVLDVERSIFKDLVDEIVRGETSVVQGKPNRRRKQLFSKKM